MACAINGKPSRKRPDYRLKLEAPFIRGAELQAKAREVYEARIAAGVAREQARKDLPLSTYTEAYWKIDLHNLLHFLNLRLDDHAQSEIRAYARSSERKSFRNGYRCLGGFPRLPTHSLISRVSRLRLSALLTQKT